MTRLLKSCLHPSNFLPLLIVPASSNPAVHPCSKEARVSPRSFAAGQHIPEAHITLVVIGPWSWLRFVKLVEWYASLTA